MARTPGGQMAYEWVREVPWGRSSPGGCERPGGRGGEQSGPVTNDTDRGKDKCLQAGEHDGKDSEMRTGQVSSGGEQTLRDVA